MRRFTSDASDERDIRPSPLAGRWYPADAARLAAAVDADLAAAQPPALAGRLVAVLVPHAGHYFSGPVAAHAFKPLRGLSSARVVVIGPSHHPYPGEVVTTAHDYYETPLGTVPVDRVALGQVGQAVDLRTVRRDPEHSLEIELPYLQRVLTGFRLVPLALLDQSLELVRRLGQALARLLVDNADSPTLLVASSDLSHFYPQAVANQLDGAMLEAVASFDPVAVLQTEAEERGFACGRGAISAMMIAARALGADAAQVLHYATSGDVNGDHSRVVGYGAAAFVQRGADSSSSSPQAASDSNP